MSFSKTVFGVHVCMLACMDVNPFWPRGVTSFNIHTLLHARAILACMDLAERGAMF